MVAASFFKTITAAAILVGTVLAQDPGEGYIFKCTRPGVVALTFDDGPGNFTDEVLGYLDAAQIKATFFVIGDNVAGLYGDGLVREYQKGHQIAYHTNSHANLNNLTAAAVTTEMTKNIAAVKAKIGVEPVQMRPPYGNCNPACAAVMKKLNLAVIQWNLDSNDWTFETKVAQAQGLYDNVMKGITPSNPAVDNFILLMHEIHGFSVKFVPKIIESIKAKGYTFDTVSGCLGGTVPPYKEGWGVTYNGALANGASSVPPSSAAATASVPASGTNSVVAPTGALTGGSAPPNANTNTTGGLAANSKPSSAATLGGNSMLAVVLAGLSAFAYVLTL